MACFSMVFENFILCVLGEQKPPGFQIDQGISATVKDSTKLSMTKSIFDGRRKLPLLQRKILTVSNITALICGQVMDILSSRSAIFW